MVDGFHNNMAQSFAVGQAPWEKGQPQSFAVGSAPWESPHTSDISPEGSDDRSLIQKGLGLFLDPIIDTGALAGRALGALGVKAVNAISGGALDKYTPEGDINTALQRAINTPDKIPVITGAKVTPAAEMNAENIIGRGVSTVALGVGNPAAGGALLGLGGAMENNASASEAAISTVVGAIGGKITEYGFNAVAPYVSKAIAKYGTPFYEKIVGYIPEASRSVFKNLASHADSLLPSTEGKIPVVSDAINKGNEMFSSAVNKPFEVAGSIKNKVVESVTPKTLDQILATPEEQLYKLSKAERDVYFANERHQVDMDNLMERNRIATEASQGKQAVKDELSKNIEKMKTEAQDLSQRMATASRDEVLRLRPKIVDALGRQSEEYRRLVDEELLPLKGTNIQKLELKEFVEKQNVNDPIRAKAINDRLGISEGGSGAKSKPTTVGELYNKTLQFGQEIRSVIKNKTRVFTPDEKLTDDTIHTIVDFLKEKGVDLSKARKFWARYAPIRNQLVREAKPFLQTNTDTGTFANRLVKIAKGKDINNQNFINEVENLLGEKVGSSVKDLFSKLSAKQKEIMATKIESQVKLAEIQLNKKMASEKLAVGKNYQKINQINREYDIERKARYRDIIRKVLIGASTAITGNQILKKTTGLGVDLGF